MAPHVFTRQENHTISHGYIAGGLIAAVVLVVVILCVLRLVRNRRTKAKKKHSDSTPFRVKGIIRPITTENNSSQTCTPAVSSGRIATPILIPEKSTTFEPNGLHDKAGISPKFIPFPPSRLSIHSPLLDDPPGSTLPRPRSIFGRRHGRTSSGFSGYIQHRFFRVLSSSLSFSSPVSPSQARLICQSFEPTLPDELASRRGEYLTVLRCFDDGWCVVARDISRSSICSFLSTAGMRNNGDNVDIGLVPMWVFSEPFEGVASPRPFRSTSFNVLRSGRNTPHGKDWADSWTSFA